MPKNENCLADKRVLVCIPNYGTAQLRHTVRQLEALNQAKLSVDVIFHTTHPLPIEYPNLRLTNVVVSSDLGEHIPWLHRRVMAEQLHNYDLFVYAENDILIEAANLAAFLELDAILPPGTLAGFLRFEFAEGDSANRYLPDAHGDYPVFESLETHGGELFFSIRNKFQSSFVLTRAHLQLALQSGAFLRAPGEYNVYGLVESAATDVYVLCGLHKVLSFPRLESLLVRHLSDKYANLTYGIWARKPHTVESLRQLVRDASTTRSHWAIPQITDSAQYKHPAEPTNDEQCFHAPP